jgi:hypothetical protein
VNDFNAVVDYAEMFASFAGVFVDLRTVNPKPDCLHPDPFVGYPAGNSLAESTRNNDHNGIVYPSVRHDEGPCLAALWSAAVQSVAPGRVRVAQPGNGQKFREARRLRSRRVDILLRVGQGFVLCASLQGRSLDRRPESARTGGSCDRIGKSVIFEKS